MNKKYKELIAKSFRECVENTIKRRLKEEITLRPFHVALLSDDVIFWSGFERSFSTSFGQSVIEELARLIALSNGAEKAERQHISIINIDTSYFNAISEHLKNLRSGTCEDISWDNTLSEIRKTKPSNKTTEIRIISDVWWIKNGIEHFVSLKTVKPNIDQTEKAKEALLQLSIAYPNAKTYFGLPYNPYGTKEEYNHTPPKKIFDFKQDSVVLVGKELWDTIGGEGCYEELLSIARKIGKETKKRIEEFKNQSSKIK